MAERKEAAMPGEAIETLHTVRDWFRYAVTRLGEAGVAFGHGTTNAVDEAAYLILATLKLPIDRLDPFLDARLLEAERRALAEVIAARIATRKPAAYLTGEAYIGPYRFEVDERVIVPRSFIGELLVGDGLAAWIGEPRRIGRVLDLCTGSGCLAIIAALELPHASVDAVDISADALAVAAGNVASYGLEGRVSLFQGDLFAPLGGARYDLVIANPPYVRADALAAFPPEYRAEPAIAHAGGADGLDIVRRIIDGAAGHLAPEGSLLVEIGSGQETLIAHYPGLPFVWLDTEESEGEVFWLPANALGEARRPGKTAVKAPRNRDRSK
ncbi:MAG: 50S ribosomal protein L3 N(5)-glutamine methyltransferase [Hyphomicrobiaceae bacterium]